MRELLVFVTMAFDVIVWDGILLFKKADPDVLGSNQGLLKSSLSQFYRRLENFCFFFEIHPSTSIDLVLSCLVVSCLQLFSRH